LSRGIRRQAPALAVAVLALLVALGGSVYAATKIDGHSVKAKSLPGNRLVPGSVPGNRLKQGTVAADRLEPGSVTGAQVDAATLGQVPRAAQAETADSARLADSARYATAAGDAASVNGHVVGCTAGTRAFAGACWQVNFSLATTTAPGAAAACADQGGELPGPLELLAFAQQPGIAIAAEGEWTGVVTDVSGENAYAVVTITSQVKVASALPAEAKRYRCVLPLLS
jgi:hypothetical protein